MCLSTPSPTTVNKRQAMSISNHVAKRPKTNLLLKRINTVVTNKPNASVKDLLNGDLVKTKISTPPVSDTPNVRPGTRAFIQIMLHTRSCSSCEDSKCKKNEDGNVTLHPMYQAQKWSTMPSLPSTNSSYFWACIILVSQSCGWYEVSLPGTHVRYNESLCRTQKEHLNY